MMFTAEIQGDKKENVRKTERPWRWYYSTKENNTVVN